MMIAYILARLKTPHSHWDIIATFFFIFSLYAWYYGWPETKLGDWVEVGQESLDLQGGLVES